MEKFFRLLNIATAVLVAYLFYHFVIVDKAPTEAVAPQPPPEGASPITYPSEVPSQVIALFAAIDHAEGKMDLERVQEATTNLTDQDLHDIFTAMDWDSENGTALLHEMVDKKFITAEDKGLLLSGELKDWSGVRKCFSDPACLEKLQPCLRCLKYCTLFCRCWPCGRDCLDCLSCGKCCCIGCCASKIRVGYDNGTSTTYFYATQLLFSGEGVTVSQNGGTAEITIPGGGGTGTGHTHANLTQLNSIDAAMISGIGEAIAHKNISPGNPHNVSKADIITGSDLITGADIADNSVTTTDIVDGTITANDIADSTITTADLANDCITSAKIDDGAVSSADLASDSVNGAKIVDGSIGPDDLANSSITSVKISDGAVATIDLADNAVTTGKIADGTVGSADIADNAVTGTDILDGTVSTNDIQNNTIQGSDLANNYALLGHNHDGVYSLIGHSHSPTLSLGGNAKLCVEGSNLKYSNTGVSEYVSPSSGSAATPCP